LQKGKEEDPVDLASVAVQTTRVPSSVQNSASVWPTSLPFTFVPYTYSTSTASVDAGKPEKEDEIGIKDTSTIQIKVSRLPPLPRSPRRNF
jgi:hypothetical protein